MENRFKRLRYKDDLCFHKLWTMDELAEELQISKATISHLEASEDYDARISILKQYKKVFPQISYDYLLGAKNTKSNEYSNLEHELPLGDQFYKTLRDLFYKDDFDDELDPNMKQACIDLENEMQQNIAKMLESLFSDSNRLFHFLSDTYKSLFNIYLLEHPVDEKDHVSDIEDKLAFEWYKFTQATMEFFKTIVYTDMQSTLETELKAAIQRKQNSDKEKKKQNSELNKALGLPENHEPF